MKSTVNRSKRRYCWECKHWRTTKSQCKLLENRGNSHDSSCRDFELVNEDIYQWRAEIENSKSCKTCTHYTHMEPFLGQCGNMEADDNIVGSGRDACEAYKKGETS